MGNLKISLRKVKRFPIRKYRNSTFMVPKIFTLSLFPKNEHRDNPSIGFFIVQWFIWSSGIPWAQN